jgi:hypothetical protein
MKVTAEGFIPQNIDVNVGNAAFNMTVNLVKK